MSSPTISTRSTGIAFLLGAGASVDADAPDTRQLVEGLGATLVDDEAALLKLLVERLRMVRAPNAVVDIEELLAAIEALEAREQDHLAPFVEKWKQDAPTTDELRALRLKIYGFIRDRLVIEPQRTGYLEPLLDFGAGPIDVFSLNYDTAIEAMCEQRGVPYTDGFDVAWNATLFDDPRFRVRLRKLHGSLLWHRVGARRPRTVKIAVNVRESEVTYFTGEPVGEALLYPGAASKSTYREPHASLVGSFRATLATDVLLIVIGCSLRDEHVRTAILEHIASNPQLNLLLVGPNAAEDLDHADQLFDDGWSFRDARHRIFLMHGPAASLLDRKRLFDRSAFVRNEIWLTNSLEQVRQVGRDLQLVDAVRVHLLAGIQAGWGYPIGQLLESQTEVEAQAIRAALLGSSDFPVSVSALVLAAVFLRSSTLALSEAASEVYRKAMNTACRFVPYDTIVAGQQLRAYVPAMPGEQRPSESPNEFREFFADRQRELQGLLDEFTQIINDLRFHLSVEANECLTITRADLTLAFDYFTVASISGGIHQSFERMDSIPVADADYRIGRERPWTAGFPRLDPG